MTLALQIIGGIAAGIVALGAVVWLGNRSLKAGGATASAGGGDMFGAAAGIFDPGTARAMDEIKQFENTAAPLPLPDPDDRASAIDLDAGTAKITRPDRG